MIKKTDPNFGKQRCCPDITFNGETVTGAIFEEFNSQGIKIAKCRYAVTCYQCGDPCVQKNALSTAITLNNKFCSDFNRTGSLPLVTNCNECEIEIGRCYDATTNTCYQGVTAGACNNLLNIVSFPNPNWSKGKVTISNNSVSITGAGGPCPTPPIKGSCCIDDGTCIEDITNLVCQTYKKNNNKVYFSPDGKCPSSPTDVPCIIPPEPVSYCYDLNENGTPVCAPWSQRSGFPGGGVSSQEQCMNGTNSDCPKNSACYYYDTEINPETNEYYYYGCDGRITRTACTDDGVNNMYVYGSDCDNINHPRKPKPPPSITRWYCATNINNQTNSCQSVTGNPDSLPPGYDSEPECIAHCRNPNGSSIS
jgi:hypothetical protein